MVAVVVYVVVVVACGGSETRTHTCTHENMYSKDLKRTHSTHGSAHTVSGVSQVEVNVPCM